MLGEKVIHLADAPADDNYRNTTPPEILQLGEFGGLRTLLMVPLRTDNAFLGVITAFRLEVRPFTDKQIALMQNFAAQAVIAMENARLITETREALEQQTATAEVLQVINSSPGDLAPVFDAMLEKAVRLCDSAFGMMSTWDGERIHRVAWHGISAEQIEAMRQSLAPAPGTPGYRIAQGENVVCIADLVEEAAAPPTLVQLGGRSYALVALRHDGTLLGGITIFGREVRPFTDKEIALLQNFAAQAVIAMENARLLTETREALEQQTATAEVLQVINSSPGELQPVFDAMLEKALRLCEAAFGTLVGFSGERFQTLAQRGLPAPYAEYLATTADQPGPGGGQQRVLRGERVVHFTDMMNDAAYRSGKNPMHRAMVDVGGARSGLIVPLRRDDAVVGTFMIYRQEVRPFTDKQIALLQSFAAQAVIAMENARLITETREALEQQTATAEVLGVINSSPGDLTPVFNAILEKAHSLCGIAYGGLAVYDGEYFRVVATRGYPEQWAEVIRRPFRGGSFNQRLVRGERYVHTPDLLAVAPELLGRVGKAASDAGFRTNLMVPLRKDNTLLGHISASRREVRPFSEKEIALLQSFAAQAVIAMENARLLGELRQRTEEVAELNRGLEARVAEQVEELGRVGRLKRFLAPQLAELIVSQGDEKILESHRREIVVVFCDLRGYTAFTETAEPEEVLDFLREYHGALGPLVAQFEGTLDQFSGDGIMVFFNDPVPIPDPAERAVKMAMAMREAAGQLTAGWRRHGYELGFGAGIAQGYATLGQIGFSERSGYTAIGTVCNLAARLCAEAKGGQILVSSRIAGAVEAVAKLEDLGNLELKGLSRPVAAFNVSEPINRTPV